MQYQILTDIIKTQQLKNSSILVFRVVWRLIILFYADLSMWNFVKDSLQNDTVSERSQTQKASGVCLIAF